MVHSSTFRPLATLTLALAILAATGCLFDTRDPDLPGDAEPECPWEEPTTLDAFLLNLTNAMGCGRKGGSNYARLFVDSLLFQPDSRDVEDFGLEGRPEVYLNWSGEVESLVFDQIAASSDSMRLSLVETQRDESGGEAELKEEYTLTTYEGADSTAYTGVASLTLRREGVGWKIAEWVDERNEGTPSWGRLKGENRL